MELPDGTIQNHFTAGGEKTKTTGAAGTREYLAGFEFTNGALSTYQFGDGRLVFRPQTAEVGYQYYLKDHLGNVMLTIEDKDGDGKVSLNDADTAPGAEEVVQRELYYPFGMSVGQGWWEHAPATADVTAQDYRYNGKELDASYGLNWYFYGARMYDPAVGRFTGVDPIADQFAFVSVYNYAENRVPNGIDLWGLQYVDASEAFFHISSGQTWAYTRRLQSGIDAYGDSYIGTSVPISLIGVSDSKGNPIPRWRGAFSELSRVRQNLVELYKNTPKTKSGRPDRRYKSTRGYEGLAGGARTVGRGGLVLIGLDVAHQVRTTIKANSDYNERRRQTRLIENSWDDVIEALNSDLIDSQYHNMEDLSSIANFVFQGADSFGDNEELCNTAIRVSRQVSGNYRGDDEYIQIENGMDNIPSTNIVVRPPNGENP